MAGLVPAIHGHLGSHSASPHNPVMLDAWIYMMTNRPNGILYLGVTVDLIRRVWQHREGLVEGFTGTG
jgi:putative endonuclease